MAEEESPWQQYSDGLVETGCCVSATICGLADASYWAYTGDHVPQPEEAKHIANCFKDSSLARSQPFRVGGNKYFVLRAEPDLIMCKLGGGGCICMHSTTALVLVCFAGDNQPAHAAMREVETMVTNFKEAGY